LRALENRTPRRIFVHKKKEDTGLEKTVLRVSIFVFFVENKQDDQIKEDVQLRETIIQNFNPET
jgi:hypothetical protein